MNRAAALARMANERFDVVVIGGGATGLGAALDAAARGYATALIEARDFASGTSSRSTKLVHGGVRYLQQGDIGLVREALRERTALLRNAPHLVAPAAFVVPAYAPFALPWYGAGLAAYDLLAGATPFARSRIASAAAARALFPALQPRRLRGAVVYADGVFDDARLAIALARSADDAGAAVANAVAATGFAFDANGRIAGVHARDAETGGTFTIRTRAAINATGVFADETAALADRGHAPLLAFSRGSHVVVRAGALGEPAAALLVPHTSDGRVLFAVPWHEHVLLGTTDVPVDAPQHDPSATAAEIAFILDGVNRYLERPLTAADVRATFAGLRPLVRRRATTTAKQSREHVVDVAPSGLVTVTGGKWTTYRVMAADAVDAVARAAALAAAPPATRDLVLHGGRGPFDDGALRAYGSDASAIRALCAGDATLAERLHPALPYVRAEVVYAARSEMARTVDDVLARRTRAAFLDASAARAAAPGVAALLARELGRDDAWAAAQAAAPTVA